MMCPSCNSPFTEAVLDGQLGASLTCDYCTRCQVFWFDTYESLQLSPRSILKLFRTIGEQTATGRPGVQRASRCPRCSSHLLFTRDLQRNTPFSYWRCEQGHGRLITFLDFLREKNFIRPLTASQLDELRENLQSVNCSNCGAPIDLAKTSSCTHCGTALSMLDMNQAARLIAELQQADRGERPVSPTWSDGGPATAAVQPQPGGKREPGAPLDTTADLIRAALSALVRRLDQGNDNR